MSALLLKAATRALVERLGGIEAAAAVPGCRVGKSVLAAAYAPSEPGSAAIDVIAALEAAAGEPLVTAELARQAGCRLVPLVEAAESDALILGRLAASMAAGGRLADTVARALADGALSPTERAQAQADLALALAALGRLGAALGRAEGEA